MLIELHEIDGKGLLYSRGTETLLERNYCRKNENMSTFRVQCYTREIFLHLYDSRIMLCGQKHQRKEGKGQNLWR